MKKQSKLLLSCALMATLLAGCGTSETVQTESTQGEQVTQQAEVETEGRLQVVATNSILADMAKNVGGDTVEVYSVVPIGTDPHEYEALPADIQACSDADIVFYNGLNLETGNGWFDKLMETTGKVQGEDYFVVSEGVQPKYLTTEGQEGEEDPHAWLNIENGILYSQNMARVMSEKDPENAALYQENCDRYVATLSELHEEAKTAFEDIPEEKKLLVTSEGAFKYFCDAYNMTAAFIWEINTESQGTPEQMTRIIDIIHETEVPVLFVETSIDARSMEQVSAETGLPIFEKIFTDSLSDEGGDGDTYYNMMKWNITKIHEGLSQ